VQNALVRNTGRNGITYAHGASGIVDGATVTGNARDGVAIDAAQGTVINSQINQNADSESAHSTAAPRASASTTSTTPGQRHQRHASNGTTSSSARLRSSR